MKNQQTESLGIFLKRTGNLLIHLLDRCNLHCKHCYLSANVNGKLLLPIDLVQRTLDEANELGIKSVQFSGGEPLLYPHIDEVLKSTIGKNFVVTISTNSTLINEHFARLFLEAGVRVVTSIDGPEEYHDIFRGKSGCFTEASKGISHLTSFGVPVKIVTTVCEDNIKYIDWCVEWALNSNIEVIQFQPLENIGRGNIIQNKRLQNEKLHDLFIHLNDLSAKYAPKGLQIKMTYQSRDFMIAHPCSAFVCNGEGCHRSVEKELKKIVIREDGTILPELVDIDRQFTIGNIFDDTLKNNLLVFLEEGYANFDQLCREVYNDMIPNNPSPLIPWNEILTEKSKAYSNINV